MEVSMNQTNILPHGTNIRLLFQQCQCEPEYIHNPEPVRDFVRQAVENAGLIAIKDVHYTFEGGGYTIAVILAESHVVLHTWPEYQDMVLVELSVCDFMRSNRDRAIHLGEELARIFQPETIRREILNMIPGQEEPVPAEA